MESAKPDLNFFQGLIGVELEVPCNTWNEAEAIRCFGHDFENKHIKAIVTSASLNRKSGDPKFGLYFPDKKYNKRFTGYDLEYILKYSDEVPLKYKLFHDEMVAKVAKQAEDEVLLNTKVSANSQKVPANAPDDSLKSMDIETSTPTKNNKRAKSTPKPRSAKKHAVIVCDESSDSEVEVDVFFDAQSENTNNMQDSNEIEEHDYFDPENAVEDVEDADLMNFHLDSSQWDQNVLPYIMSGPNHVLTSSATPFDYFCLFLPIFLWAKWALYTNLKAELGRNRNKICFIRLPVLCCMVC